MAEAAPVGRCEVKHLAGVDVRRLRKARVPTEVASCVADTEVSIHVTEGVQGRVVVFGIIGGATCLLREA